MTRLWGVGSSIAASFRRGLESETVTAIRRRVAPSALVATILLPVIGIAAWGTSGAPGEYPFFGTSGANLLDGHWSGVFANPGTQAGPFEFVPFGIAKLLGLHGHWEWFAFYVVTLWAVSFILACLFLLPIASVEGRRGRLVPLVVLGVGIVITAVPMAVQSGHLADMMIPLMWIVAACLARERHFAAAGVLIGLSAGFEVWGVMGAPIILIATSPRVVRAAVGAVVAIAITYLPFVLTGVFRMFGFHWGVMPGSLYRDIWPSMDAFPWPLRLVQAGLAVGAGIVAVLLVRRSFWATWLVPAAILSVRLVFDPLLYHYYWVAPMTVAVCVLAVGAYLGARAPMVIASAVLLMLWFTPAWPLLTAIVATLIVAGSICAIRIAQRRWSERLPVGQALEPARVPVH